MHEASLPQRYINRTNIVLTNLFGKTNHDLNRVDNLRDIKTRGQAKAVLLQGDRSLQGLFTALIEPKLIEDAHDLVASLDTQKQSAFWNNFERAKKLLSSAYDEGGQVRYTVYTREKSIEVMAVHVESQWDGFGCPQFALSKDKMRDGDARVLLWMPLERDPNRQEINMREAIGNNGSVRHVFEIAENKEYSLVCYKSGFEARGRDFILQRGSLYPALGPWQHERT